MIEHIFLSRGKGYSSMPSSRKRNELAFKSKANTLVNRLLKRKKGLVHASIGSCGYHTD